jgi:hypothetical protein
VHLGCQGGLLVSSCACKRNAVMVLWNNGSAARLGRRRDADTSRSLAAPERSAGRARRRDAAAAASMAAAGLQYCMIPAAGSSYLYIGRSSLTALGSRSMGMGMGTPIIKMR